jgi:hypothetical protein
MMYAKFGNGNLIINSSTNPVRNITYISTITNIAMVRKTDELNTVRINSGENYTLTWMIKQYKWEEQIV